MGTELSHSRPAACRSWMRELRPHLFIRPASKCSGVSVRVMDSRAVLSDPSYLVPQAPGGAPRGTLAWLREHVCRFSNGAEHARRRALAVREIEALRPDFSAGDPVAAMCAAM